MDTKTAATMRQLDEVESHKVYEIKNNRINNKLKDTTLVAVNSIATNKQIQDLSL